MTDIQAPSPPQTEPPIRRRRRRTRPSKRQRALVVTGGVMVLAGALVLGWLGWQFWGTNWVSHHRQAEVTQSLQEQWNEGHTTAKTDFGTASAIVHIPRFGAKYAVPVLEGTTDDVLAAGIGHMDGTAAVGDAGNYVLAAHRVTHGEPFADFPSLRAGDLVDVDTATSTYTYVLDTGGTDLVVPFTDSWVLAPFPRNPTGGTAPPAGADHLITLVTCSEVFHTDNRSVAFGHLVSVVPRDR